VNWWTCLLGGSLSCELGLSLDIDLEKQADRIIDEIWKTEALERIPRAP